MEYSKEMACKLASELLKAEETAHPVKAFSRRFDNYTVEDAYGIQAEVTKLKMDKGRKIIGKKIGFTSEKLRQQYGVNEPDYGMLMDDCILMEHESLCIDQLIWPRVEAEIAFVLNRDLDKPNITVSDVICATEGIMPAIEIVDSRFENWQVNVADTIADNAANARILLGGTMRPLSDFDLRYIGLTVSKNGQLMDSATGSAVFGNPIHAVVWLGNKLYELGAPLKKGEIIMSGSFTPVFDIKKGDYVEAVFDRLGRISVICK